MSFVVADRVRETSTTSGTGDLTLAGAVTGYQRFSAVCAVSDIVPYVIIDGSSWEVGIGTYSASNTLTRTKVLASSNSGSAVSLSSNSKDVLLTFNADFAAARYMPNLLDNPGFRVALRGGLSGSGLADGSMTVDAWYLLTQSSSLSYSISADTETLTASIASSSARIGLGQYVPYQESISLVGSPLTLSSDVTFFSNGASAMTVRMAVLEWTSTADAGTRDIVNDWTSGTFTAGNFFKSNLNVLGITSISLAASALGTTKTVFVTTSNVGSSAKNIVVFIWTDNQLASSNSDSIAVSKPVLVKGKCPGIYTPMPSAVDVARCMRRYRKSYKSDKYAGDTSGNDGMHEWHFITGFSGQNTVQLGLPMLKVPSVTAYSPTSGTAAKGRRVSGAADTDVAIEAISQSAFSPYLSSPPGSNDIIRMQWVADAEPCS